MTCLKGVKAGKICEAMEGIVKDERMEVREGGGGWVGMSDEYERRLFLCLLSLSFSLSLSLSLSLSRARARWICVYMCMMYVCKCVFLCACACDKNIE